MSADTEKKLLSPYIDDELSPARKLSLAEKIKNSAELQSSLEEMQYLKDSVKEACSIHLPSHKFDHFCAQIKDRLNTETKRNSIRERIQLSHSPLFLRIFPATVAAILILMIASFGIGYKKGEAAANSVTVHEMSIDDSTAVDYYEGQGYSVLRLIPKESTDDIQVNYVATAEGVTYNIEHPENSNSVIIRLTDPETEDENGSAE